MATKVINSTNGKTICTNCKVADRFLTRLKGLMGQKHLPDDTGIIIRPCNSIHTFMMQFSIDVIFLNQEDKVIAIRENVIPWRITLPVKQATQVMELSAGRINTTETAVGDQVVFKSRV